MRGKLSCVAYMLHNILLFIYWLNKVAWLSWLVAVCSKPRRSKVPVARYGGNAADVFSQHVLLYHKHNEFEGIESYN